MSPPTIDWILSEYKRLGYPVFKGDGKRSLDLNIIGVRTLPPTPNAFDDYICLLWWDPEMDKWCLETYRATTDPGTYWLNEPSRTNGTAVLVPGRYPRCWKIGAHKGEYPALVQNGAGVFRNWRDNNRDAATDYSGPVYSDVAGLNLHHAGTDSSRVDKWSAACQVIRSLAEWGNFWTLIKASESFWGPTFSYVLLERRA